MLSTIWTCIKVALEPDRTCKHCGADWLHEKHANWCPEVPKPCVECQGRKGKHAPWCWHRKKKEG